MGELIKITKDNGKHLVSARELHEFLGLSKRFSAWFEQYSKEDNKYGFEDGVDFTSVLTSTVVNNGAKRELDDYAITIDMAKEISMITGTEKGKEARKYFINCENKLKEVNLKANLLLSIYNGGQNAVIASKQLAEIEVEEATQPLLEKIENDKPLVEFSEQVLKSNDNILIRELAKIISDEIKTIGQNRLYEKLREWGFVMKNKTEPYQKHIDNGYFVLEEKTINTPYGRKITKTCKVTPRGQIAIVEKFRKELLNLAS
jgi:anti-repressor protein